VAGEDRSQQATPRHKQEARKRGQVARSRELSSALSGFAGVLLLGWQARLLTGWWKTLLGRLLQRGTAGDPAVFTALVTGLDGLLLRVLAPSFAVVWSVALLASIAQGGLVFSPQLLALKWERISPVTNIGNLFSTTTLSRALKSLLPGAAILYLALAIGRREWTAILTSPHFGTRALLSWMADRSYELAWKCGLILVAWSVADYLLQRHQLAKSLRMTKQEVSQETKDTEGSPFVRSRIRRRQRELRKRWTMKDVERATAVVANPQHVAIALEYRPESMAAPTIVAKGLNETALRIKDVARWNGIPIVENPPLAQALYRAAEVGEMIPAKVYAAVAEILAFIYRTQAMLRNSAEAGRRAPAPGERTGTR
jgi:flagellar biosynthesis protein FlhB